MAFRTVTVPSAPSFNCLLFSVFALCCIFHLLVRFCFVNTMWQLDRRMRPGLDGSLRFIRLNLWDLFSLSFKEEQYDWLSFCKSTFSSAYAWLPCVFIQKCHLNVKITQQLFLKEKRKISLLMSSSLINICWVGFI